MTRVALALALTLVTQRGHSEPSSSAGPRAGKRVTPITRITSAAAISRAALARTMLTARRRIAPAPRPTLHPPRVVGWGAGESLTYRIRLLGVEVARAAISVGTPRGRQLRLRGLGETIPFVRLLLGLREELISDIDLEGLAPTRISSQRKTGHKLRTIVSEIATAPRQQRNPRPTQVRQTIERSVAATTTPAAAPQTSRGQRRVGAPLLDPLAALYLVRSVRLGTPKRGANKRALRFLVLDGAALYDVRLHLSGSERLQTAIGPLDCLRIEGVGQRIADDGRPLPGKTPRRGTAWLTADARRIPVRIQGDTDLGYILAEVTSYSPPRRALAVRLAAGTPL